MRHFWLLSSIFVPPRGSIKNWHAPKIKPPNPVKLVQITDTHVMIILRYLGRFREWCKIDVTLQWFIKKKGKLFFVLQARDIFLGNYLTPQNRGFQSFSSLGTSVTPIIILAEPWSSKHWRLQFIHGSRVLKKLLGSAEPWLNTT